MSEVQSVGRTLAVLEQLAMSGGRGVQQLARDCGLAPSTVQRLIGALVAAGLVEQDPADRTYRVGLTLFRWGQAPVFRLGIRELAKPFLQELAAQVGETIALGVRDGDCVMHVEWVPAQHLVQPRIRIGERVPLFESSMGRCHLAWSGDARTAKNWDRALRTIRAQGYSMVEDPVAGVRTVAAPVFGSSHEVVGAIGVGGHANRFTEQRAIDVVPSLIAVADTVTSHYGVDWAQAKSAEPGSEREGKSHVRNR